MKFTRSCSPTTCHTNVDCFIFRTGVGVRDWLSEHDVPISPVLAAGCDVSAAVDVVVCRAEQIAPIPPHPTAATTPQASSKQGFLARGPWVSVMLLTLTQ